MALADWLLGAPVPFLIALALGFLGLSPPDFLLARISLAVAALLLASWVGAWLAWLEMDAPWCLVVAGLAFGVIGLGWHESWRYVLARQTTLGAATAAQVEEAAIKRLQSTPPPPAPSQPDPVTTKSLEVLPKLTELVGEGERIYRRIIGDPHQMDNLETYQRTIEDWRERVGRTYERELPNSGARSLVLPKTGRLGVGPIGFELSRLVAAIEAQKGIIADIETYVRRSQG